MTVFSNFCGYFFRVTVKGISVFLIFVTSKEEIVVQSHSVVFDGTVSQWSGEGPWFTSSHSLPGKEEARGTSVLREYVEFQPLLEAAHVLTPSHLPAGRSFNANC